MVSIPDTKGECGEAGSASAISSASSDIRSNEKVNGLGIDPFRVAPIEAMKQNKVQSRTRYKGEDSSPSHSCR